MSVFVLVHGAFRGGWAWDRVRPLLAAAGHDVHTPTLRPDAASLEAWVDQVAQLVDADDLHELILVGHSMGGVVTTAYAAQHPERIARLDYVDGAAPRPGERAVDLGGGPAPTDRSLVIPPAAGGDPRLTPTPVAPSLDPMPAPTPEVPTRFAFCSGTPAGYPSGTTRARLDADGTAYDLIDADHDAPLTAPEAVAAWLLEEHR